VRPPKASSPCCSKRPGYRVTEDAVSLSNDEPARTEGNHRWSNNGLATLVEIS
jgi:hypothetical protein